ncbi:phosphoribosyltransferase [Saccharospirillum salsuginis]|uniref:Phosphoribosyltransferase n=1 Tax=Saccharospirillum salsuginis TaxID=418750 RepID=A0A918K936_9GAMM|nr:phosphoribosyltransferase [Saccharospirillum salsuginis]GGX53105.1 phosphoribosyltransferase [Saccharospirillum salsuginis]
MRAFKNRVSAGQELAQAVLDRLEPDKDDYFLVLALPRGGVPVAFEVAQKLGAELDLMVVRKLGLPWHSELAMGAIASGGIRILNEDVVRGSGVSEASIDQVQQDEEKELKRRETAYRGDRPMPTIQGRRVIIVDDGIATGATMKAAVQGVRSRKPADITVAVPVAPPETLSALRDLADDVVCVLAPDMMNAIGAWYVDFNQTSDDEVRELLNRAWS